MSPTLANEAINAISVRFESIMTFQNLSCLLYFMIHTDMPIEFLVLIYCRASSRCVLQINSPPFSAKFEKNDSLRGEKTFCVYQFKFNEQACFYELCTCVETIFSTSMKNFFQTMQKKIEFKLLFFLMYFVYIYTQYYILVPY